LRLSRGRPHAERGKIFGPGASGQALPEGSVIEGQGKPNLGGEIRRLRLLSGTTLRRMAVRLGVSAAHLSDIEHDRRRPSDHLLRLVAHELRSVGASYDGLHALITGIDPELRDWVATTPGVRKLLLRVRESGRPPHEILELLEGAISSKGASRKRRKNPAGSVTRVSRKRPTP
jgi:transcriptional regulator with XRE-family HTH domain